VTFVDCELRAEYLHIIQVYQSLLKGHYHGRGGNMPASRVGFPGFILGQCMWEMWWNKMSLGRGFPLSV